MLPNSIVRLVSFLMDKECLSQIKKSTIWYFYAFLTLICWTNRSDLSTLGWFHNAQVSLVMLSKKTQLKSQNNFCWMRIGIRPTDYISIKFEIRKPSKWLKWKKILKEHLSYEGYSETIRRRLNVFRLKRTIFIIIRYSYIFIPSQEKIWHEFAIHKCSLVFSFISAIKKVSCF